MEKEFLEMIHEHKKILSGVIFLVTGVLAFFTTRFRYRNTIGIIKRNLEEMKSFEKEE